MRYVKPIIGMLLIAASVFAMFFWEAYGRERVVTDTVAAAAADIPAGTVLTGEMIAGIPVLKENVVSGAMTPSEAAALIGLKAATDIPARQQVTAGMFYSGERDMPPGKTLFRLDASWIANMSSSVRRGDLVDIYDSAAELFFGTYEIAFAKDSSGQEVWDAGIPGTEKRVLDRTSATSVIDHVEIITTVNEYAALAAFAAEGGQFLLVQRAS